MFVVLCAGTLFAILPSTGALARATVDPVWSDTYAPAGIAGSSPADVAVAPDGGSVYVVGAAQTGPHINDLDIVTIAFDPASGDELWSTRYDTSYHRYDQAGAITVSPDGETVFVTGTSTGRHYVRSAVTVAYDAATGVQRWEQRCCGTFAGGGGDMVASGSQLYVLGYVNDHIIVLSYDAATGARAWTSTYPRGVYSSGADLEVGGGAVFVIGEIQEETGFRDGLVLALDQATGDRRWHRTFDGKWVFPDGYASSGALSPDGATLFTTGVVTSRHNNDTTTTIAYDAATGGRLWASRIQEDLWDARIPKVEAAADGSGVVVAATSVDGDGNVKFVMADYGPSDGVRRWLRREPMGDYQARVIDLALSPDGDRAYVGGFGSTVAGAQSGWLALAYDTAVGGAPTWIRSAPLSSEYDAVVGVEVAPDGTLVYLTGERVADIVTEAVAGP
jgi:DNA-binding beta-propeller fold protein YncE